MGGSIPLTSDLGPLTSKIYVGTSGWSYEDWRGVVYPAGRPGRFDELAYLAQFFDAVEVNTSFYRPPSARFTQSWLRRTQFEVRSSKFGGRNSDSELRTSNSPFMFTFKLWQRFTHERETPWSQADADLFRAGLDPVAEAGRLGAVLVQFPWSFRFTDENVDWLGAIARTFPNWPLVLEVRHASWGGEAGLAAVRGLGYSFCNIDQPPARDSIPPGAVVTGHVGYVRLHGRNRDAWFNPQAGRDQRYNYLYRDDELADWVTRIGKLANETEQVYVFTNNHYRGQAPANALQILAHLRRGPVAVPEPLARSYPFLDRIALPRPPGREANKTLF